MPTSTSTQNMYTTTTSAPPPTPSTQPNPHHHLNSTSATMDALSRLLHRLPPTLSLPTRRTSATSSLATPTPTSPPPISLSEHSSSVHDRLLSASSQHGFFQLDKHSIPPHVANSAESDSLSLFKLSKDKKQSYFPKNWPFGFDDNDEDANGESFWLDGELSGSTELTTELSLSSLRELTRGLEKVGLELVEMLSCAVGFENPFKENPTRVCSMMLVNEGLAEEDKPESISGGCYPCIIGLQYVIRSLKYWLLTDSGWVAVLPEVDSVLVTIGDIAQVWSNGKLKKVRGRSVPCIGDNKNSNCISMTLLLTLPTETIVSPLLPKPDTDDDEVDNDKVTEDEEQNGNINIIQKEKRLFSSFSFEDYAWRVYHEPLIFKDPLDIYKIST